MIRVFVAAPLPSDTVDEIRRLQRRLEADLPAAKWVRPEQFHFTLSFLGDVAEEDTDVLAAELAPAVAKLAPFEVELAGLGAFPNPTKPHVLWIGVTPSSAAGFTRLHQVVHDIVAELGLSQDDRFHPHVTLARFNRGKRPAPNITAIVERHKSWTGGTFAITEVGIFKSELSREGSTYTRLETLKLGYQ